MISGQQLTAQLRTAPEPTLNSPNNTMTVHLYYLQPDSYQPSIAARTIAPGYDSTEAVELAIKIKQVLDGKGLYVRLREIPSNPEFTDTTSGKHYYTPFPTAIPQIYLERVDTSWYYSYETAELIRGIHKSLYPLGSDFLVHLLPRQANQKFLGLATWQHLGLLLILLIMTAMFFIMYFLGRQIIKAIVKRREKLAYITREDNKRLSGFFAAIIALWVARMLVPAVQLPIKGSEFAHDLIGILMTVFVMLLALAFVTIFKHRAEAFTELTETKMDEQLLPIITRLAKIVIVTIAIFYILKLFDVNITALIAGISIGGLALALAAQDTVKNLIGSVVIFVDKPFQIGDYIIVAGLEGTVTEVGFRSTRIMTIDTSIISIPNGQIANMSLTNLGLREARLFNILIAVTYDTPAEKMRTFIDELRKLVQEHAKVQTEPYFIHLRELADSSINIMFRCYLLVPSFGEELALKEELLFEIIKIAENLEVEFAFPTTTVHMVK